MKIRNKNGDEKAVIQKNDFPLYSEVETEHGTRWYKTIMTNQQKICTVSATEQEIKLINYLKDESNHKKS